MHFPIYRFESKKSCFPIIYDQFFLTVLGREDRQLLQMEKWSKKCETDPNPQLHLNNEFRRSDT